MRRVLSLMVFGALSLAGCKEGNPLDIQDVSARAHFSPDAQGRPLRSVALVTGRTRGQRITLDIVVTSVDEPVAGIAMTLTYPSGFAKFLGCLPGEIFSAGPCIASEPKGGEVFVSRSAPSADDAVPVVGPKRIASLQFLVFGRGGEGDEGRITIEAPNVGGGETTALVDKDGQIIIVDWFAGRLEGL